MRAAETVKVYLGLGGNVGDVSANFMNVVSSLNSSSTNKFICASSIYHSPPWGGKKRDLSEQADYLNQVIEIGTSLSPTDLLQFTQSLEASAGREMAATRWAERPLDIDILLYGNKKISLPKLEIPHLRMLERAFVMLPLLEVAPGIKFSGLDSFIEMKNQIVTSQKVEKDSAATRQFKDFLKRL